jgi:hypothetical protein
MVTFRDDPVGVETQRRPDGTVRPLAFVWRGRLYRIVSWGRESAAGQGEGACHCYLVQTANLETWELCRDTETAQWTLRRHWARNRGWL